MRELKKLVEKGKVKRTHVVHLITAVQNEWSLSTIDLEDEIVPTCSNNSFEYIFCIELGIGIIGYIPIGWGFLDVGPSMVEKSIPNDLRNIVYERVNEMATRKGCTSAQLALT
uniref:NADP-dependent oxidoreductase domain-containing protein n=1 Tax=Lactuca sativa TaxID=4236 RepID=A0A9R1UIC5_LACSA|nr:hypothetical protein LSAT_V11C900455050 [Lactuca sativa]